MPDLVPLRDLRAADRALVGAKAANLGELIAAGLPVPDGFCLSTAVYERVVLPAPVHPAEVEAVALPEPLRSEIEAALATRWPAGARFAVRSSGTGEDTAAVSAAGQYHTELDVSPADVPAAVLRCWASLWEPHAVHYRERQGTGRDGAAMAVIVQELVDVDAAGVLFTVDPHGGADDRMVIEASWGRGDAVVGGLVTPDRFDVARGDATIVRSDVRQDTPSLTDAQVRELARLGLAVEEHFGAPQDIEWALADGRVQVLQARPITRLPAAPEVSWESPVEGAWWARISICDSWLPEPLSPLFASTLFPCLVRRWQRNWAGPESVQRRSPLLPRPMTATINGYAYLRFDYHLNRYPLRAAELVARWFVFHLGPLRRRWRTRILPRHVARITALGRPEPAELDNAALLGTIDEVQELSGEYWAIIGGLAWYWNVAEWLLVTAYPWVRRPLPDNDRTGPGALLQGYPSRTFDAEAELAELAGADPDGHLFAGFLDRYGHQVYNLDFVEPTPAEDPSSLLTTVEAYRDGTARDPHERLRELAGRRDARLAALRSGLRRWPLRRAVLAAMLRWNRRQARLRDEALFHFTLGWPLIRRGYLELGRRLAAAGVVAAAADVFYLTGEELRAALRAVDRGAAPAAHHDDVDERRVRHAGQHQLSPPVQVPADARMYLGRKDITTLAIFGREADAGAGLRGSAVSPGQVTAPARLISSVQDFGKLRPGEVLVAPHLTPAWSSLLAIAGGVVTDLGGVLSHGSIVAREYGIPAVMGTHEATKVIHDGQVVTIDGDRGLVY